MDAADTTDRVAALLSELDALDDPKRRAVNERHGDDHGVNLSALRQVAKRLKTDPPLALALWATDVTAARLLAILVSRPKTYDQATLDRMLREAGAPKVHDWLVNYIVQKGPHAEALRTAWLADDDPVVESAGWALTSARLRRECGIGAGIDADALLDRIERDMVAAPERLQWAMNETLATIGIEDASRRDRALEMGERLGVLRDYPTPANCTSPFAPAWIAEIVRRREGAAS